MLYRMTTRQAGAFPSGQFSYAMAQDTSNAFYTVHLAIDAGGAVINPATEDTLGTIAGFSSSMADAMQALAINAQGSLGVGDFSSAAIDVSAMALLGSIPATLTRLYVEVQNQSNNVLVLVKDAGNGTHATSWMLDCKDPSQPGLPGATWSSHTHKGRVSIYGPAGSQFAAYQD